MARRAPPEDPRAGGGARAFFLAVSPAAGRAELEPEDAAHARRVLRLGVGDTLVGLDGQGGRWPLRVTRSSGGAFEVEASGPVVQVPAPGEAGNPLPWIEIGVCLPKEKRAEAMLDRLVQLGVAALSPLWCERNQGALRELTESRAWRLRRAAREACKQSGRTWLPVIHPTTPPAELVAARPGAAVVLLDPGAQRSLLEWVPQWVKQRAPGSAGEGSATPILVLVGPEGGFTRAERVQLEAAGAEPVALGPHVLRIETAAEAALAGLVLSYGAGHQKAIRSRSET